MCLVVMYDRHIDQLVDRGHDTSSVASARGLADERCTDLLAGSKISSRTETGYRNISTLSKVTYPLFKKQPGGSKMHGLVGLPRRDL